MNELIQKLADYNVALEAGKHLAEPANEMQTDTWAKNDPALIEAALSG